MSETKDSIIRQILDLSEKIFNSIPVVIPPEWFTSDLTVAQLRILLLLHLVNSSRMSAIASMLEITLPTATGIVDNLVKKDLVTRETDPQDRRAVICKLSPYGQALIDKIWVLGQSQMERLLNGLTVEELEKATEVAQILLKNALRQASEAGGG